MYQVHNLIFPLRILYWYNNISFLNYFFSSPWRIYILFILFRIIYNQAPFINKIENVIYNFYFIINILVNLKCDIPCLFPKINFFSNNLPKYFVIILIFSLFLHQILLLLIFCSIPLIYSK